MEDLKKLPNSVHQEIGYSLYELQKGKMPENTKPLKGMGAGIMEIVNRFNKSTYRAVYALKLGERIYVLHVFQKKSHQGIKTPKKEIDLIKHRILWVKQKLN